MINVFVFWVFIHRIFGKSNYLLLKLISYNSEVSGQTGIIPKVVYYDAAEKPTY